MLVHLQVLAASAGSLPPNTNVTAMSVPISTVCSPRIVASYIFAPQKPPRCYCWNDRATCEAIHNLAEARGEDPRTRKQRICGALILGYGVAIARTVSYADPRHALARIP